MICLFKSLHDRLRKVWHCVGGGSGVFFSVLPRGLPAVVPVFRASLSSRGVLPPRTACDLGTVSVWAAVSAAALALLSPCPSARKLQMDT